MVWSAEEQLDGSWTGIGLDMTSLKTLKIPTTTCECIDSDERVLADCELCGGYGIVLDMEKLKEIRLKFEKKRWARPSYRSRN